MRQYYEETTTTTATTTTTTTITTLKENIIKVSMCSSILFPNTTYKNKPASCS